MAQTNLGKVSMTLGGAYNGGTVYARLTIVMGNDGNGYVSKVDDVAGIEPGVTVGWDTYWQQISTHGRSIVSIAKTSSTSTTDTFTITYDDGSTSTFTMDKAQGVPSGGTVGQLLRKNSSTDYDASWASITSYVTMTENGDGTYSMTFG